MSRSGFPYALRLLALTTPRRVPRGMAWLHCLAAPWPGVIMEPEDVVRLRRPVLSDIVCFHGEAWEWFDKEYERLRFTPGSHARATAIEALETFLRADVALGIAGT